MINLSDSITTSRKDEVRINCPFCGTRGHSEDTKYKMYVNVAKGKIHCFRCGYSKHNINDGLFSADHVPDKFLDEFEDTLSSLFSVNNIRSYDMDEISWKLTKDGTPIAYSYIISRGFTDEEIADYDLRVGKDYHEDGKLIKKWSGRILFPYKNENGDVLFVVGRSYAGKEPKYINSTGNRSHAVYGLSEVNGGIAAACEGIIDAISFKKHTGIPGVCGLGKEYTSEQVSKIASKCRVIYEALDGDVDNEIRFKLCMSFAKVGIRVKNLNLPPKEDPNSIGVGLPKFIKNATEFNPLDYLFDRKCREFL